MTKTGKPNSAASFSLNIFVELRAEAVTAVMPALGNCIFQSRHRAGLHMINLLCVVLVYVADTVFANTHVNTAFLNTLEINLFGGGKKSMYLRLPLFFH